MVKLDTQLCGETKTGHIMGTSSRTIFYLTITVLLLFSTWVLVFHLDRESIWYDEGFTAYILHDDTQSPDGIRETLRYIATSFQTVFERASGDVHPLLYYVLMDSWTLVMGEATWILRLPSVFFGLMALAGTYALGRELFDEPTGLIATFLLAMSHFFIYYNREARMYTLLVAIVILLMLAMVRWLKRPTIQRGLIMGVLMGLLMHTHYLGVLIIMTLLAYQFYYFLRERRFMPIGRWFVPHVTGFLIFWPWLPFAIRQLTGHPDGPLGAVIFPTEWGTITWLWDIMTSSHGGLFFIGFIVGGGLLLLRQRLIQDPMMLLLLWFIITPIGLLLINSSGRAVIVARYMLVSLPALMLACAFGLRHIATTPSLLGRLKLQPVGVIISVFVMAWIIVTQLTTYSAYWADKPRWKQAFAQLENVRQSDEPAFIHLPPHNVANYYSRHYDFQKGISIDIGWTDFVPEQLYDFVNRFDDAESVWTILPSDSSKTWYILPKLADGRTIGYRDSVQNMVMYRFDKQADAESVTWDLRFYSADKGRLLAYQSGIGHRYFAETGQDLCFPVQLEALQNLDDSWRLMLSLTQGYGTTRAQAEVGLSAFNQGDIFEETLCIPIPEDTPRGPHLLRIALVHESGFHQPIVESDEDLFWGFFIGVAWVAVDTPSA